MHAACAYQRLHHSAPHAHDTSRAGCTFANLGGNATLHGSPAAILDANANFVRCRFQDNIIGGSGAKFHGVITAQWEASVRLENSTFFGTIGIGVHLLDRSQEASFYTDSIGMWVVVQQVGNERPSPLTAAPKDFLTAEDDWFMNTQMVPPPPPPSPPS